MNTSCQHVSRVRAVAECDLSRTTGDPAKYTAQIELFICRECGDVTLAAKSPQALCDWLEAKT